ncbi:hypothetical protein, partial [Heyndrickxia coagulans]|uniref:hypothetical protein n=1 Tax=Heyndrickxia coagulans TaxID=1398 RepID=UPI003D2FB19A
KIDGKIFQMWISHFIIKHLKIDEFTLQNCWKNGWLVFPLKCVKINVWHFIAHRGGKHGQATFA